MPNLFKAAQARASHWGHAAKGCVTALGGLAERDRLGFVYASPSFAEDLGSIVTFLRETTPVADWVAAIGHGICGPQGEAHDEGVLTMMVADLPPESYRIIEDMRDGAEGFQSRHGAWVEAHQPMLGLVHGDPRDPELPGMLADLAEGSSAYLVGGLALGSGAVSQMAGHVGKGALSGVLFGQEVAVACGLSQGCSPIGPPHIVTEAVDMVVMKLDNRPALEVLKEEAGEIIARDLRRAAGYIHAALPITGSDTGDYMVRSLVGVDPEHGWLAISTRLSPGDQMLFVRRDPKTARADLQRMLRALRRRAPREAIRGGIYVSCMARGPHMFGTEGAELAVLREELGEFPLIGFFAGGEISHSRLYSYTGVLALFLDKAP